MYELYLFFLFIYFQWKTKKVIICERLLITRDLITVKEVEDAVESTQKYSFEAAMLIYTQILSLLKDKTVIQIQMYGLGKIWRKRSNGTLQLAVAFKLYEKFQNCFPEITLTSQEPTHFQAEIEYLRSKNVYIFDRKTFSSDYFLRAANKVNVSEPMLIVYMIHFPYEVFDDFLEAHWNAKLLSQFIFVGNKLYWPGCYIGAYSRKRLEYLKLCEFKSLPFEWPKGREPSPDLHAAYAFGDTQVYTISYDNAKRLISIVS